MNQYKEKYNIAYLIPLIIIFSTSELFVPFESQGTTFDPQATTNAYVNGIILIGKIIPFVALLYTLYKIEKLSKLYLFFYALPLLYFIYLIFESLFLYKSFIQFPHVFLKITNLFVAFAIYIFYKNIPKINLDFVMNLILIMLFIRILMDPSIVSISSFVNHERMLHAPSIYMLLLPCLYFFNKYAIDFDFSSLVKFLISLFFIIYFQHRTVWVATSGAFIFNIYLLKKQDLLKINKAIPTAFILVLILISTFSLLLTYYPEIGNKINENIINISNPNKDSTGTSEWRMLQYQSYWPYVKAHFIEGMRLKGFELPIQFYHPEAGVPFFADGTGHHFHSFYYDILFWFGIIGILIFLPIMINPIYMVLKYNLAIDHTKISYVSFVFSGFLFSVSYNLPDFYWAIVGLAMAFISSSKK